MTTMRQEGPPAAAMRAATALACHRASWLPRVPSRRSSATSSSEASLSNGSRTIANSLSYGSRLNRCELDRLGCA